MGQSDKLVRRVPSRRPSSRSWTASSRRCSARAVCAGRRECRWGCAGWLRGRVPV